VYAVEKWVEPIARPSEKGLSFVGAGHHSEQECGCEQRKNYVASPAGLLSFEIRDSTSPSPLLFFYTAQLVSHYASLLYVASN
jgi:hypothetical protein